MNSPKNSANPMPERLMGKFVRTAWNWFDRFMQGMKVCDECAVALFIMRFLLMMVVLI